ncbi:cof-like hydrolase [Anaerotruncus sp. CAG:390]|nr:cof-like hydrolase [Anaerotruncus sp. CAG:390]
MKDLSNILILTDLDGTFFGARAKIIQRNIDAIERFKAAGGLFTIATGRMHMSLEHCIPNVRELVNAPVAVCNGTYLYDFSKNHPTCEHFLDRDLTRRAIDFMFKALPTVCIRLSVPEGYMTCPPVSPMMERDLQSCPPENRYILPVEEWMNYDWYKVVIRDKPERLVWLRRELRREMGDDTFEDTMSGPTFFELQKKGCTKALMIPELRRICQSPEHPGPLKVYAVGDYDNDISMIKAADVGVCPSNALDEVKKVADLCLCSNEEGVIADLIEHIEAEN